MNAALVAALVAAALTLGCNNSNTTAPTTSTTTTTVPTTQMIQGLLYPLDEDLAWVDIDGVNGTITATLVSTTAANPVVGLGIGLRGTTCLLTRSVSAVAGTQLSVPVEPGSVLRGGVRSRNLDRHRRGSVSAHGRLSVAA